MLQRNNADDIENEDCKEDEGFGLALHDDGLFAATNADAVRAT